MMRFQVCKIIHSEQIILRFKFLKSYTALKYKTKSDKMQKIISDYLVNKGCSMGLFIGLKPVSYSL